MSDVSIVGLDPEPQKVRADQELANMINALRTLRAVARDSKENADSLRDEVLEKLSSQNETGFVGTVVNDFGSKILTASVTTRTTLNRKRLVEEHPELESLLAQYDETSESVTVRVL
jgi:hypothetical protein